MTNEEAIKRELIKALASMNICIPLLEELKGKIPSDITDILKDICKLCNI